MVHDGLAVPYKTKINNQFVPLRSDRWYRFKMGSNLLEFDLKRERSRKKAVIRFDVNGQMYEMVVNTKVASVLKVKVDVGLVNGKIVTKVQQLQ